MSEQNRWKKGLIRHLTLDPAIPLDEALLTRDTDSEGFKSVFYTLRIHPERAKDAESLRAYCEANADIGGVFSSPRDV